MIFPTLNPPPSSTDVIDVFLGMNKNPRVNEGEFAFTENLTSDNYPLLSPRGKRGVYATARNTLGGLISNNGLWYVDGSCLVREDERIDMGLSEGEKELISMGAYIIILPDKKYLNTANLDQRGDIEATYSSTGEVTFTLCRIDGSAYEDATISDTPPEKPENLDLWIDTSATPHTLNQYSSASDMWIGIATTYIRIGAAGIGAAFEKEDGVKISGIVPEALQDLNSTLVIWDKGEDYIVVTGVTDEALSQTEEIRVSRLMPDMDFVTQSGNRLWGCRYGLDREGNTVNEIYASKLGDFKNWNCFGGVSTDSYAASIGSDGPFTGAATHLGFPLFFKENHIHKVYGTYPATYQIQSTSCRGVAAGSHKSIATVNEVLYYLSPTGVCGYDGSLPVDMSSSFGTVRFAKGVAGANLNKYYLSAQDLDSGEWSLMVLDTRLGLWHREDDSKIISFCSHLGDMLYYSQGSPMIMSAGGKGVRDESPVKWAAETGLLGVGSPYMKYLTRIDLRMWLEEGGRVSVLAQYDSLGRWERLGSVRGQGLKSFTLPLRTKRCDHLRLRIEGEGQAGIFALAKTLEGGSDRP